MGLKGIARTRPLGSAEARLEVSEPRHRRILK
jgi:hypothetical protein